MIDEVRAALLEWYARHGRDLPWRRTRDPYAILVSEVMLQQTQVERVRPKWEEFLEAFPTLRDLAAAPLAEVIRRWAPLGYNQRAVRLHRLAAHVVERLDGELPREPSELRRLPGLGEYTANAVACFAFERPVAVVDTNVERVIGRVFADRIGAGHGVRALALEVLPAGRAYDWNQALMDLGATVCIARSPRCLLCPLQPMCVGQPARSDGLLRAAESRQEYRATPRFEETDRYYRGRIVDAARALSAGEWLALDQLMEAVGLREDSGRFERLVSGLERDGLVFVDEVGRRLRLP